MLVQDGDWAGHIRLAVEDFLTDLGEDPPANLHLDDEEFIKGIVDGTITLG